MIGSDIGHYRVVRRLGKGGMGEVYLADDTKLQRQVALKLLDPAVAGDPNRRERFAREARAVASLNHPNIVTIHSVEEAEGRVFLTLEYVDGRTLAEMIDPGGLPVDRLLAIAISLTDAVGAAHQRGITHRDLKPANVMITADGRVKVLDFGLAKLREDVQLADDTALPTQEALTGEGRILGTVAYMSPEQAEGRAVDHRSDVFSLGVMLYEMAVGERPFKGDTQLSVLSSILRDTPPSVTEIKAGLPRDLARIIRRCLAKDPEDRYQTAKDLRNDLRGLRADLTSGDQAAVSPRPRLSWRPAVVAAAVMVLVAVAFVGWRAWRAGSQEGANDSGARAFASLGLTRLTTTGTAGVAALSGDGRYVAHVVISERGQGLWLRQVATSSNVEIVPPSAVRFTGLAFSPDGNYVLYIIYPQNQTFASMFQVPVLGGATRQLVYDIDSAPAFSPDGARFAFVRGIDATAAIMLANADGGGVRELARRAEPLTFQLGLQGVAWSPDGTVLAVAGYDRSTLTTRLVLIDVASGMERPLGDSEWRLVRSVAWLPDGGGLLVNAQEAGGESTIFQLWVVSYPSGVVRRITTDLSSYSGLSLSRDGRTLVTVRGEERSAIWVSDDTSTGAVRMVSTSAGADDGVRGLAWAADGRLLYTSTASGNSDIWIMNADGTGRLQLTTDRADDRIPSATPDGRYVVFLSERGGGRGIWRMTPGGSNQTRLGIDVLNVSPWTPFLSRDGRWVTYTNQQLVNLKIPIEGGAATSVFDIPVGQELPKLPPGYHDPALSPDGRVVMGHYLDEAARGERIVIMPVDNPGQVTLFPSTFVGAHWAADGRSIIYIDNRRQIGNLWRQPLTAGPPVQVTHFDGQQIYRFAYTRDGRQLAVSRGAAISDIVLMTSREEIAPTR
jgi:Tol biopolymer transport system component/predicted Ser/Thr protein kinase